MRIYTAKNDPLDFCDECAPTEEEALELYGEGEGPDGRGNCFAYDAEHPDYDDDDYRCHECGTLLGEDDSGVMWRQEKWAEQRNEEILEFGHWRPSDDRPDRGYWVLGGDQ
jgi:hypothetical protein